MVTILIYYMLGVLAVTVAVVLLYKALKDEGRGGSGP